MEVGFRFGKTSAMVNTETDTSSSESDFELAGSGKKSKLVTSETATAVMLRQTAFNVASETSQDTARADNKFSKLQTVVNNETPPQSTTA